MTDLRESTVFNDDSNSLLLDSSKKKKRCGMGRVKCFACIIFLSGTSALSFYLGVKYGNHLEDNDGSL
tara:strand:+ start:1277 stop:1480 length:204 start_codon:yes stop_codon:yes gene_type:complete